MKRLIAFFYILIGIVLSGFSQTTISGGVASQSTSEPIIGAMIEILKPDSTVITAMQTNTKGNFVFSLATFDKLIISVKALGFHSESILISGNSKTINMGNIYLLDKSIELSEVTVEGAGMIEKVDRYIVIPTAAQIKRSAGSIDLLNNLNLPGLDVDLKERTASIGGQRPVFQINGIPKSQSDILALNPDNVLRIEYSDNPGIRHINQGAGGVINFILKQRLTGGSVYERLDVSPTCGAIDNSSFFAVNYKKSEFSISYNLHWRSYDKKLSNSYEEFIGKEYPIYRESKGINSPFSGANNDIVANYTYQHDLNTIFNAKFIYSIRPGTGQYKSDDLDIENNITKKYSSHSRWDIIDNAPALDLFWKKKFKGENTLEFNVVGTYIELEHNRTLTNTFVDHQDIYPSGVNNKKWSIISEVAYSKAFKDIKMSFGAQDVYSNTHNSYIEPENAETRFNANDAYLYGQILGKIKKVSYTLGTGLKIFSMDNHLNSRTYYNNMSTVRLVYTPLKDFSIEYMMLYKPDLPSLYQLDDVVQTSNDLVKKSGNPDLKPSNYIRNRITIKYKYDKVWSRLWAIYDNTSNPIVGNMSYDGNYFVSKPINANYSSKLNLQFDLGVEGLWKHLDLRGSIYWNKYISDNYSEYHHTLSNITLKFDATVYFGKWVVSGSYSPLKSKTLVGESITINDPTFWIQVQYNWKNFYFSAGGGYFFQKHGPEIQWESLSKVNPSKSNMYIIDNANWVNLSVTYRLNFGRQFKKSGKSLSNSDSEGSAVTIK